MSGRKKIQFYVSQADAEELEKLRADSKHTSLSEMIRQALSLYRWILPKLDEGGELVLTDAKGEKYKVVLPRFR